MPMGKGYDYPKTKGNGYKNMSADFNPHKSSAGTNDAVKGVPDDAKAPMRGPNGKFVGTGANKPGYAVRGVPD